MEAATDRSRRTAQGVLMGALLGLGALLLAGCLEVQTARPQFAQKNCLECHKKFSEKLAGMTSIHPTTKANKCESCPRRQGLIPKAALKKDGNEDQPVPQVTALALVRL